MSRKPSEPKQEDYEVGFGKPPTNTRFQKGQSGNPQGRPKGARNVMTMMQAVFNERVTIVENGKRKSITKMEAGLKQIANRAAAGDDKALKSFLLVVKILNAQPDDSPTPAVNPQRDQQLLAHMIMRIQGKQPSLTPDASLHEEEPT